MSAAGLVVAAFAGELGPLDRQPESLRRELPVRVVDSPWPTAIDSSSASYAGPTP
jgi:hypothetical protein